MNSKEMGVHFCLRTGRLLLTTGFLLRWGWTPGIPADQEEAEGITGGGFGPTLGKYRQAGEELDNIVAMISTILSCVFLLP